MPNRPPRQPDPALSTAAKRRLEASRRHLLDSQATLARISQPYLARLIRRIDNPPADLVRRTGNDGTGRGPIGGVNRPTEGAVLQHAGGHGDQADTWTAQPEDPTGHAVRRILDSLALIDQASAVINHHLDALGRDAELDPGAFEPTCRNCGDRASVHPDQPKWRLILDRCEPCYRWWRKHGTERPLGRLVG